MIVSIMHREVSYDPETEMIISVGVSQGLAAALAAILHPFSRTCVGNPGSW